MFFICPASSSSSSGHHQQRLCCGQPTTGGWMDLQNEYESLHPRSLMTIKWLWYRFFDVFLRIVGLGERMYSRFRGTNTITIAETTHTIYSLLLRRLSIATTSAICQVNTRLAMVADLIFCSKPKPSPSCLHGIDTPIPPNHPPCIVSYINYLLVIIGTAVANAEHSPDPAWPTDLFALPHCRWESLEGAAIRVGHRAAGRVCYLAWSNAIEIPTRTSQ